MLRAWMGYGHKPFMMAAITTLIQPRNKSCTNPSLTLTTPISHVGETKYSKRSPGRLTIPDSGLDAAAPLSYGGRAEYFCLGAEPMGEALPAHLRTRRMGGRTHSCPPVRPWPRRVSDGYLLVTC